MSATTVTRVPPGRERLTGTRRLTRFALRRDRVRIPIWAVAMASIIGYFGAALPIAYPDHESLQGRAAIMMEPSGALLAGPGYGLDDYNFGAMLSNEILGWLAITAALMSIFLVVRHTRTEEETGRAELVRAGVVGRHAQLTSALLNVLVANLAVTTLLFAAIASNPDYPAPDAFALAAGVGLVGIVFGGVAAIAAQVTEHSRSAVGMAGAVLGLAYVLRGIGDAQQIGGTWVSWLSPIGWAQQTRAFVDLRWWPLALPLALTVVLVVVSYLLAGRRDFGAGLVAARRGRADASRSLRSPFGLSFRIERAGLIGWGVGLFLTGVLTGSMGEGIVESFEGQPQLAQVFGLPGGDFETAEVLRLAMSRMLVFFAMAVAVYAVISVNRQQREETEGRTGMVLGTAVSRPSWTGGGLAVTTINSTLLLLASGLGFGLGIAGSTGESGLVWDFTVAGLVYLPVVLGFAGLALLAYGFARGGVWWVWTILVGSIIFGLYGPLFNLPDGVLKNLPFALLPELPGATMRWAPVLWVSAAALALLGAGTVLFRRRNLIA